VRATQPFVRFRRRTGLPRLRSVGLQGLHNYSADRPLCPIRPAASQDNFFAGRGLLPLYRRTVGLNTRPCKTRQAPRASTGRVARLWSWHQFSSPTIGGTTHAPLDIVVRRDRCPNAAVRAGRRPHAPTLRRSDRRERVPTLTRCRVGFGAYRAGFAMRLIRPLILRYRSRPLSSVLILA